jgi:hypothetical protein
MCSNSQFDDDPTESKQVPVKTRYVIKSNLFKWLCSMVICFFHSLRILGLKIKTVNKMDHKITV